jgi:hypothetical protein
VKRVLLDENIDIAVRKLIVAADVRTVTYMGWNGYKDRQLLDQAEARFDVLVTNDKSLPFQQSMIGRRLAVVIVPSAHLVILAPMQGSLNAAVASVLPGTIIRLPKA